jgi:hypothetical protein
VAAQPPDAPLVSGPLLGGIAGGVIAVAIVTIIPGDQTYVNPDGLLLRDPDTMAALLLGFGLTLVGECAA